MLLTGRTKLNGEIMADYIGATPLQNPLLGLLAERLKQAQGFAAKPFGYSNPPAEMLMNLLGVPAVQQTAERLAYGEPLTTGRGMTTQIRPEAVEAALTVAPAVGLLGKAAERGAMAAGRAGERVAVKYVPQIMESGGLPAQLLGDLSQGSIRKITNEASNLPMRTFKTSDGFTLYELKNGKIVDNLDPEGVDMSWDNFKQLKDDFGDDVYQVNDQLGERKAMISSFGTAQPKNLLDNFNQFMETPTDDVLYQRALNKQNEPINNVVQFPKANLLETAEPKAAQSLLDTSYRGSHTAPGPDFGAPLYDLTGGGQMYPADVYSSKAVQYYGTGYPKADKEAFALANKVRGNPDAEVTMYRAVPKDASIESINKGDWVTLSKDYAKNHGESVLDDNYKIISQKVKAKDLWTNADSIHEFGYWPE